MEKSISNKSITVVGVLMILLILIANIWLYFGYSRPDPESFRSAENLEPVDITSFSADGKKLFDGLTNNSGIPIPEPSGKMGKSDPFAKL